MADAKDTPSPSLNSANIGQKGAGRLAPFIYRELGIFDVTCLLGLLVSLVVGLVKGLELFALTLAWAMGFSLLGLLIDLLRPVRHQEYEKENSSEAKPAQSELRKAS